MPIRWTPENDQLLLVTILETHEINLDFQKIANAWRAKEDAEKPTPRAIKERIFRIRTIIKTTGANGALNMGGNSTTATTPKSAKSAASTPKTPVSSKRKRDPAATAPKKNKKSDRDEGFESDVMDIDTPSKKPANTAIAAGFTLKTEDGDDGGSGVAAQMHPPKRVSKQVAYPGMVQQQSPEEGDEYEKKYADAAETSGSGFVLEDFVNMGRMADITDFTAVKSEEEEA